MRLRAALRNAKSNDGTKTAQVQQGDIIYRVSQYRNGKTLYGIFSFEQRTLVWAGNLDELFQLATPTERTLFESDKWLSA